MFSKYPVSEVASLLADPARVAMLTALLGGESRPAGDLARLANLSPQAASAHLARLTAAQMLVMVRMGRHHY
jgi:DNA-binding transcriptional ArsR family regulator